MVRDASIKLPPYYIKLYSGVYNFLESFINKRFNKPSLTNLRLFIYKKRVIG